MLGLLGWYDKSARACYENAGWKELRFLLSPSLQTRIKRISQDEIETEKYE